MLSQKIADGEQARGTEPPARTQPELGFLLLDLRPRTSRERSQVAGLHVNSLDLGDDQVELRSSPETQLGSLADKNEVSFTRFFSSREKLGAW
jgi:hypothetical protein